MALIDCPECGTKVSDKAEKCPSCAYPINKKKEKVVIKNEEGCFLQVLNAGCFSIFLIVAAWIIYSIFFKD